jgi:hypothetical protein
MLLITSSPRQFVNCLSLLRVLFLLCACGSRDVSPYPPTTPSGSISAQTPASSNSPTVPARQTVLASGIFVQSDASSHRVNGEPSWLVNDVLRENATMDHHIPPLRQPTLVGGLHTFNISIFPTHATLAPNQSLQFRAGIKGDSNHAVKWLVEGHEGGDGSVGTVSATGLYTAPPRPAPWSSVTITAVSAYSSEILGSAVVLIEPARRVTSFHASH